MATHEPAIAVESICQSCGACCATSANWPRFSTEDDRALDLIPAELVNARASGMRCDGDRCAALKGKVGEMTSCSIYEVRPDCCRAYPHTDAKDFATRTTSHSANTLVCPAVFWIVEQMRRRRSV